MPTLIATATARKGLTLMFVSLFLSENKHTIPDGQTQKNAPAVVWWLKLWHISIQTEEEDAMAVEEADYERWKLYESEYWILYLRADDQRYLGRAYAWLKREGKMQLFSGLSIDELADLRAVLKKYEGAVARLWKPALMPEHFNYLWLGNEIDKHGGHGHMHIVPRYSIRRMFAGVTFVDENWKGNYTPHNRVQLTKKTLKQLVDRLRRELTA
ncbi:hypothetical protein A2673_03915 [Candidatus Kaiserbacteria bacterium RIFCSPHIGHO2_01_FULL_50_13]|uniref:HIT domain-containing protein n=1 Tax=Candidatus Kaiserbacteria bacterium RIFCSPLOWO2_01_FULL_50_24 TaxID=1798507 RepID=A0A1F6EIJ9_9BACT|nr:MAG: hypothetical protein A2673_03915 [Candidatus Kaiserbacteria bacterium RIFCSPHIGHO2_01_FULL_50_13]OGG73473.1 MAG: hypothetical protein A3A34_01260 [Candidatus Kaiserbacteria bacterium RIFCSPLOWO2_01_FULL_50_24]OGG80861.1 MAG: hypothetical protein A3H74_02480 [Candidatus Kaiserbacteria bacterium RIFCSPLOWO2_02_FULL_51_13]